MTTNTAARVVVLCGGLAGLSAAAYVARAGRRVAVLEEASELGGRAATHEKKFSPVALGPGIAAGAAAEIRPPPTTAGRAAGSALPARWTRRDGRRA
jgi:phytoene dehydrogenase-like protein